MTNDEVLDKIHEEFILRGMSAATEDSYQRAFRIFLRHCENRSVETLGEEDIREFLFHQISIGKSSGTVISTTARCVLSLAVCWAKISIIVGYPDVVIGGNCQPL